VALLAVVALSASPAAQAAPFQPVLTGTNPASPGATLTPRIQGREGGIISSVVRTSASGGGTSGGGPFGRALDPDATITVYEGDPTCLDAGAVVKVGTVEELEDPGILVPNGVIAPDSVTTFYATQADASGTSACSNGLAYRQVTTPPDPPVLGSVNPASPANENFPHLIGTADPEAIVSIFSDATCSGAPLATGAGAAFAASGIQVPVSDNSTTTFYASATLGGVPSGCSSFAISYQEVTPKQETPPAQNPGGKNPAKEPQAPDVPGKPPAPKLRTLPAGAANNNTPLVTGSAPGAGRVEIFADAGCKGAPLAKGSAAEFAAGLRVQVLDNATVSFYGVSIDGGNDRSPCSPDPAVYFEDSTAPLTRITMGPGAKTRKRTAVFRFLDSAGETPGTTFLCKLDRRKWKSCAAPFRAKRLSRKAHSFQVKAVDLAGNREEKPAKRRFKVIR
jgi:hypothetical protein